MAPTVTARGKGLSTTQTRRRASEEARCFAKRERRSLTSLYANNNGNANPNERERTGYIWTERRNEIPGSPRWKRRGRMRGIYTALPDVPSGRGSLPDPNLLLNIVRHAPPLIDLRTTLQPEEPARYALLFWAVLGVLANQEARREFPSRLTALPSGHFGPSWHPCTETPQGFSHGINARMSTILMMTGTQETPTHKVGCGASLGSARGAQHAITIQRSPLLPSISSLRALFMELCPGRQASREPWTGHVSSIDGDQ
jgi:hypothetical protein